MQNVLADRAPVRLRRPARLLRLASDERLVALIRGGDEGAFEALYDRHHPAILGFCRHMLGTREEAEDAVQHTFLSAFRDLVRSDKPIELRPWLFAIARNRCLSLLRARRPHVEIGATEPATDGLTATVERREELRELLGDLAHLPVDQRAALLLAELGALDHDGIATVLGCPREKVKALVFQARTSLAASREARATPCEQIRIELATASGAALRRGPLRRHLRICAGCNAFKAEVATQRKLLALALPVVPSVALKASVLSGGIGGATASGGGAVGGGLLGTVASTGAGKAAVSLAVAGAVASGGALTERLQHNGHAPSPSNAHAQQGAAPRVTDPPWIAPSRRYGAAGVERPGTGSRASHRAGAAPSPVAPVRRTWAKQHAAVTHPPAQAAPAAGGSPGQATKPPGQGATLPAPAGTPPGHGRTPPGHGGTPPRQAKKTPPEQAKTAPGHGGTPPGQANQAPPEPAKPPTAGTAPPDQSGTSPGSSGSAPGHSGASHGHGG
jgi:RNA polymerase sigma factor (sigma-70 family)